MDESEPTLVSINCGRRFPKDDVDQHGVCIVCENAVRAERDLEESAQPRDDDYALECVQGTF